MKQPIEPIPGAPRHPGAPGAPGAPDAPDNGDLPAAIRRRRQTICGVVLVIQGVYLLVTLFTTPSLIGSRPVLLELLRPTTAALVAGGAFARVGRASLVLALIAPVPVAMMSDPFVWWAGRLWGPDVVEIFAGRGARERRGVRRAMRWIERGRSWAIVLAPILPVPSVIIYAAAGWTGMPLWRFLALDLLGTFSWIAGIVALGYALGHPAVHIAHAITHYSLLVTIGLVVVSVVVSVWRQSRAPAPDA